MWINQNFLVGEELDASSNEIGSGSLDLQFASLRKKGEELYFNMSSDGNISLKCDNMDLCGDIVQALAEYLGLGKLRRNISLTSRLFLSKVIYFVCVNDVFNLFRGSEGNV